MKKTLALLLILTVPALAWWNVDIPGAFVWNNTGQAADSAWLILTVNGTLTDTVNSTLSDSLSHLGGGDYTYDTSWTYPAVVQSKWVWFKNTNPMPEALPPIYVGLLDADSADVNVASASTNALQLADFDGPGAFWNEGKTGYALTSAEHGLIEDEVYANRNDYKATGFSTHSAADVWTAVTRTLTTADWSTHSAADVWTAVTRTLTSEIWTAAQRDTLLNDVDSIWVLAFSMGDSAQALRDRGDVAWITGAGSDSATQVKIVKLATWGISDGDGDSSTYAERLIGNAGAGAGAGAYQCTVYVFDGDTVAQGDVNVRLYNTDLTATRGFDETDGNGRVLFNQNAESLIVILESHHVTQNNTQDTIVCAATGGTDSIWVTAFDPGTPTAPSLCRVYGWVKDLTWLAEGAIIEAKLKSTRGVEFNGVIVSPYVVKDTADASTGEWLLDLIPSDSLSPTSEYIFQFYRGNTPIRRDKDIEVPDSTTWWYNP